jgi:AcrR family transcriptional regulator
MLFDEILTRMLASVNTMSSETRKYELKARAESQRETRDRIARAAAELHEEIGPARTTVSEIARRAGVTRLTVYNHFADLEALLPACAAHYGSLRPQPDFGETLALPDPAERVTETLARLYAWFRETEPMYSKVFSDRVSVPEVDQFMSHGVDLMLDELARGLAESLGRGGRGAGDQRALLRLAVDFWTWQRLSREGLDDRAAGRLMAGVVVPATKATGRP